MSLKKISQFASPAPVGFLLILLAACSGNNHNATVLDRQQLAKQYFEADTQWYVDNIPFFECSDEEIEQVYYYRWKMYKAHIRNTGADGYVITEFINHVPWDRDPFCTINAASMHHIYEGRWLTDDRYMNGYINNLFQQGGNNRRYSESVADAAYARYLVNGDEAFIVAHLDSMRHIYSAWSDHFDSSKNMYWIPAMPDATEYTIASIDGSGGKDGFDGGEAFRPTINSYMYGNALAIAKVAAMKGDDKTAGEYFAKGASLKKNVETNLWNDSLQHFCDRFKMNNDFVKYWDFIRGRELAGMAPWYFDLPADNDKYSAAWKHVIDTNNLLGGYGLRTNEPSYEYYFKQFVFFEGKRGSQWNGPSWPYQTSQALTGMANVLNNYKQSVISNSDYLKLLRLYTRQHYLPDGKINLVENYDPNLGGPIVYYYWSNHYNHSSYNNLVISGLCGIRPSAGDTLDINPLVDTSINYFCLDGIRYHGQQLTLLYDRDGTKYNKGKGVSVFVNGKRKELLSKDNRYQVVISRSTTAPATFNNQPVNVALNIAKTGYPVISASINSTPDSIYQVVDGRIWYFPEISNRWSTQGSTSKTDWLAVETRDVNTISSIKIYPYADGINFDVPDGITIEYENNGNWLPVKLSGSESTRLKGNTSNLFSFDKIAAKRLRVHFSHATKQVAISEIECY